MSTFTSTLRTRRVGQPTRHVPEVETAIYRIAQEALTNARKHGGAERAIVEIVEDASDRAADGARRRQRLRSAQRTDGFGMLGMQERAQLLGGTLDVDSSPGQGTTITAVLPITRRRQEADSVASPGPGGENVRLSRRAKAGHP